MAKIIQFVRTPKKVSRPEFVSEARALVEQGRIMVSRHLYRDHPERAITQAMIEKCIEKGTIQCDPHLNRFGNWQAEMFRHMAGQELTVVVAIEWETKVIVVTAF